MLEEVRLRIDRDDADLGRAMTNRTRDSFRRSRLAASEELARLLARLRKLPPS